MLNCRNAEMQKMISTSVTLTQKRQTMKHIENVENVNPQKHCIFEGFTQNGECHVNKRIFVT